MIYDYFEHSKAIATKSLRQKDNETSDRKRPNRQKEPKSERQTLYAIIHPVALRIVGAFCTNAAESGKGCYGKWRPLLRFYGILSDFSRLSAEITMTSQ